MSISDGDGIERRLKMNEMKFQCRFSNRRQITGWLLRGQSGQ